MPTVGGDTLLLDHESLRHRLHDVDELSLPCHVFVL